MEEDPDEIVLSDDSSVDDSEKETGGKLSSATGGSVATLLPQPFNLRGRPR